MKIANIVFVSWLALCIGGFIIVCLNSEAIRQVAGTTCLFGAIIAIIAASLVKLKR